MNKNILLCVSGGIAVYKAAALTSKLVQANFNVKVIMTQSATEFVTPLTFQALSRNPVYTDTFYEKDASKIAHIDLADWADIVVVAPATANMIGKLANGIVDDMVTTTILATKAPIWIAPAMNVNMYDNPAVKRNIDILYNDGYRFVEPSEGYLACGYVGKGRLEEPEKITSLIEDYFTMNVSRFKGLNLLVTAGPTREKLDPVRFFSNLSSGKMGFAIAEQAAKLGATVTLVTGPTNLPTPTNVKVVKVESAQEMYEKVMENYEYQDVVIKSAAVADYRPAVSYNEKMKKQEGTLSVEFERTIDILKTLGTMKGQKVLIGFAAETGNVEEYAIKKLHSKNLDLVVANNVTVEGAGFQTDTNIVTFYRKDETMEVLPKMPKKEVALHLLQEVERLWKQKK
ncbi:bifunctional phosphopantothenoylcysteine decarboxylase/phosphopantothenate--cysteine ligase CoaBC [Bacillus suaedaesalsae]|uniref:Coenzyme A biosynthesis bifunctional protein CoaBC n=1 Tax=Bacillus suaedaesalsae TaxID=2810349 RepID=A0ABS2DJ33_9BACI|nr:bifunctional phosphopantothenoylcysteine decarboxylase/phosphopantothenate--cysteine ligase CoaBC [Bacillus suaedaesalsae]MBM6618500.1 bifunctional phosphopantothenoylcysteine decarboxylase/phosphopantothenate--cysteine ligase CoaBC [Bacillus suaedaesalsae]